MRLGVHLVFSCCLVLHRAALLNRCCELGLSRDGGTWQANTPGGQSEDPLEMYRDRYFIRRAISLASLAQGRTRPNPCVGCIILDKHGVIVGEGWHVKAGEPHAEVVALNQAGNRSVGGEAYVTLEPCNHFGRTPPCSLALVRSGVRRVVAGMIDPDPRVSGNGLSTVNASGAEVKLMMGVESTLCQEINAPFVFRVLNGRPHCTLWGGYQAGISYATHCSGEMRCDDRQSILDVDSVRRFIRSALADVDAVTIKRGTLLDMTLKGRLELFSLFPTSASIVVTDDSSGSINEELDIHIERVINSTRAHETTPDSINPSESRSWYVEVVVPHIADAQQHKVVQSSRLPTVALILSHDSGRIATSADEHVRRCLQMIRSCDLGFNSLLVLTEDLADLGRLLQAGFLQRLYISYCTDYPDGAETSTVTPPPPRYGRGQQLANGWDEWLNPEELAAAHYYRAAVDEAMNLQSGIILRLMELTGSSDQPATAFRSAYEHLSRVNLRIRSDVSQSSPFGRTRTMRCSGRHGALKMYRTNLWIPPPLLSY